MDHLPVVQLQGVTKVVRGRVLVNQLSFDIFPGEVFGLLGPNGAGKTTTIRMMVGLISITQGDIKIQGHSITRAYEKAIGRVGAIVENPDMYRYLSGYRNLIHYARMVPGISESRVDEIVKIVGLENQIHDKVRTYSLGMRQRLGIAQALLHKPAFLILDEPTNGLDPAGIRELRDLLRRLAQDEGVAVLVSSHLLSEIEMICDRIAILQRGKLVVTKETKAMVDSEGLLQVSVTVDVANLEQAVQICRTLSKSVISGAQSGTFVTMLTHQDIPRLNSHLIASGIQVYSIQTFTPSLEDTFLEITEE
ncbi:ABC transporter ATP-binding protein [Alicyclobacillus suci]|uniref:ABC transporter ATP-binding protein n=1 Tax=Alicyclobacillus suci TaxID=2816080 RepID=UPI001A8DCE9F|nr:ABC transporter ATP-binding protein [Alicyclobacillus suci]